MGGYSYLWKYSNLLYSEVLSLFYCIILNPEIFYSVEIFKKKEKDNEIISAFANLFKYDLLLFYILFLFTENNLISKVGYLKRE